MKQEYRGEVMKINIFKPTELLKAKYTKRTGSPGNYKYYYNKPGGKQKKDEKDSEGNTEYNEWMGKFNKLAKEADNPNELYTHIARVKNVPYSVSEKFRENYPSGTPREAIKMLWERFHKKNNSE